MKKKKPRLYISKGVRITKDQWLEKCVHSKALQAAYKHSVDRVMLLTERTQKLQKLLDNQTVTIMNIAGRSTSSTLLHEPLETEAKK